MIFKTRPLAAYSLSPHVLHGTVAFGSPLPYYSIEHDTITNEVRIMPILYRPARIDDIQVVSDVYWQSVLDVYRAHGFGYKRQDYPLNPYYAFALQEEPDGFFVAEDEGKVIGATISWVRGRLWFLSHLFIIPSYQGRGVGKTLLGRALAYCTSPNAGLRSVITMAFNPASIALYMKNGMYPIEDISLLSLDPDKTGHIPESLPGTSCEGMGKSSRQRDELSLIDEQVMGMSRPLHHKFFQENQLASGYLLRYKGRAVAYAYIWPDGRIGPVAALPDAPYKNILKAFIALARKASPSLSMMVPGSNKIALEVAFSLGFTINRPYLLLSSKPFGVWDRYLFHSPGMM
jgi:GNAT superfamily N-acetyltransferase